MDEPTPEIEADDEPESAGPKVEKFKVVMPGTESGERRTFKVRFVDDDGNPAQQPVIEDAEGLE